MLKQSFGSGHEVLGQGRYLPHVKRLGQVAGLWGDVRVLGLDDASCSSYLLGACTCWAAREYLYLGCRSWFTAMVRSNRGCSYFVQH